MPVKKLIQRIEVGSGGAASITFSAIPQTYTHLFLVVSVRDTSTLGVQTQLNIQFNSSGGTAYSDRTLGGDGSSAFSFARSGQSVMRITSVNTSTSTANTFGSTSIYIPNYRSSVAKSVSIDGAIENNATSTDLGIVAGLWTGTDPITSITLTSQSGGSFVQYSSASLYGITRGSDGTTTVS